MADHASRRIIVDPDRAFQVLRRDVPDPAIASIAFRREILEQSMFSIVKADGPSKRAPNPSIISMSSILEGEQPTSSLSDQKPEPYAFRWTSELLAINGLAKPPGADIVKAALDTVQMEESRALTIYFNRLVTPGSFADIIVDAANGRFFEQLGFTFNAAHRYASAAETALEHGGVVWAKKLAERAASNHDTWTNLEKPDPTDSADRIAHIHKSLGI